MKKIEKMIIIVIIMLLASMIFLAKSCNDAFQKIDETGGFKALSERIWEGEPKE